jgi:hypothetical protein
VAAAATGAGSALGPTVALAAARRARTLSAIAESLSPIFSISERLKECGNFTLNEQTRIKGSVKLQKKKIKMAATKF